MARIVRIPSPVSGGLILSYKCIAECKHCMYACSPRWDADWISIDDLETILRQLSGRILSNVYGPRTTGLSYGLHFTGGEPFMNFDLLCTAVSLADRFRIPSTFVETNGYWAIDDDTTREKLKTLKKKGLRGLMVSVNPFYLEYVPFERTERAVRIGFDVFGNNLMVYQLAYFRKFRDWGFRGRVSLEEYLTYENQDDVFRNVEFFVSGRAPYRLGDLLQRAYPRRRAEYFFTRPCETPFLRTWHNHFDNYGNFVPGFCGGISLGDCRHLSTLVQNGIDLEQFPILGFLVDDDMRGLFRYAQELGYTESEEGYFSKCHLCIDIRRHLARHGDFRELQPKAFYEHLES